MRSDFLGAFVPGASVFHRVGVGWKYLVLLVLVLPGMFALNPLVTVVSLGMSVACLAVARVGWRPFRLPWALLAMLTFLGGHQYFFGTWQAAVVIIGNIVTALYASRLLMSTTPGAELIDALVTFVRPLRRVGLDPEQFALTVGLTIRSIPFIVGSFGAVQEALRSRGRTGNPFRAVTPVVIRAVRYAQETGESLAARGLGESSRGEVPER